MEDHHSSCRCEDCRQIVTRPETRKADIEDMVTAIIKSNGIRSKFAIYEDIKQNLRREPLTAAEYEHGIKCAVDLLKI